VRRAELHVRAIDPVRHLHQAHQVDRAVDAVEVGRLQFELGEQEFGHRLRAVVGHFQAHGVAEVALRQFALQLGAQVGDFFLVDEQVGVAGGAELVAAEHGHAGEQLADEFVQDGRQEDEAVFAAGQFFRQADDARQHARRLDDGGVGAAPEGVLAFQFDGEVEALVEHAREGVRRVEPDRRQHRHHLAVEVFADPFALRLVPARAAQEADALFGQRRQDHFIQCWYCSATMACASAETRRKASCAVLPSVVTTGVLARICSLRPETRISKNSSRLLETMHRKRSVRAAACARPRPGPAPGG
jgi:hypothetical protein